MTDRTRPLMLGYLRELPAMTTAEIAAVKRHLEAFAYAEGYVLGGVYLERLNREPAAFQALVEEVQRRDVRAVVVPTRRHLDVLSDPTPKRDQLERTTSARVFFVDSP